MPYNTTFAVHYLPIMGLTIVVVDTHMVVVEAHIVVAEAHMIVVEAHIVVVEAHMTVVETHIVAVEAHIVVVEVYTIVVQAHIVVVDKNPYSSVDRTDHTVEGTVEVVLLLVVMVFSYNIEHNN
jgi:hypothetical protein